MDTQKAAERRELLSRFKQTTELTLPSGLIVEVRRPPISKWIETGEMPVTAFTAATGAGGEGGAIPPDKYPEFISIATKVARAAFVWPKLVDEPTVDSGDELDPALLSLSDLSHVLSWAFSGAAGVGVKVEGAEVSASALKNFSGDASLSSDSGDGGGVRPESGA